MKLPCKVVEDMLPIYYDGICSDESADLIEEHLNNCAQCSRLLSDLHTEMAFEETPVDDMKALEGIKAEWKKGKRVYLRIGMCVALAVLLLLFTVLTGIWYFSYGKYYYRLTDVMQRPATDDWIATSSDYTLEKDGYRFDVNLPIILSNSGFVRVMGDDALVLFLYPESGGSYRFWFFLTDQNGQSYSVHLKSDMTPDFENHPFPVQSDWEKQHISEVLREQQDAVSAMLNAVQELWGLDLLQYAP